MAWREREREREKREREEERRHHLQRMNGLNGRKTDLDLAEGTRCWHAPFNNQQKERRQTQRAPECTYNGHTNDNGPKKTATLLLKAHTKPKKEDPPTIVMTKKGGGGMHNVKSCMK